MQRLYGLCKICANTNDFIDRTLLTLFNERKIVSAVSKPIKLSTG
ncbi:hypothetical protein [Polynucleobacter necessarius]|nr:hypothetical protein [Polynucleobacter necessarius]